jgi:hypothetical protein
MVLSQSLVNHRLNFFTPHLGKRPTDSGTIFDRLTSKKTLDAAGCFMRDIAFAPSKPRQRTKAHAKDHSCLTNAVAMLFEPSGKSGA